MINRTHIWMPIESNYYEADREITEYCCKQRDCDWWKFTRDETTTWYQQLWNEDKLDAPGECKA